jgi:VIT1/CCC1 family predicted Fe2+/Mn2+ transporter
MDGPMQHVSGSYGNMDYRNDGRVFEVVFIIGLVILLVLLSYYGIYKNSANSTVAQVGTGLLVAVSMGFLGKYTHDMVLNKI